MIAAPLFSVTPASEANITLSFNLCGFFVYLRLPEDIYLDISDLEENRMKEGNG